jgi:GT2 family glycosyltransferase
VVITIATTGVRPSLIKTIESIYRQNYENLNLKIISPKENIFNIEQKIKNFSEQSKLTEVIAETEKGFSSALNQAFESAKGADYFGWINDDDFFAEGAVARAVNELEKTGAVAAFGQLVYLNEEGEKVGVNNFGKLGFWSSKYGPNLTPQPGSLFRVNAVASSRLLDPEHKYAMDLDLWLRLRNSGSFVFIKEPQAFMLWHQDAITVRDRKKALAEAFQIRKKHSRNFFENFLINLFWMPTKIIAYLSLKFI